MDPAELSLNKFLEPGNETIKEELFHFLDLLFYKYGDDVKEVPFAQRNEALTDIIRTGTITRSKEGVFEIIIQQETDPSQESRKFVLSPYSVAIDQIWIDLYNQQ